MGRRPAAGARLALLAVAAALAAAACTGNASNAQRSPGVLEGQNALAAKVDPGDPVLPPAAGYAGTQACIGCHGGVFASWERTAHARGLRTAGRPGVRDLPVAADSDGDGLDDFREGLDLAGTPEFAGFGASAPRLVFRAGEDRPRRILLGGVEYPVAQVYGGRLREDYLVRLGDSHYAAPIEWDADARTWRALETETWYSGTTPRFATAGMAASAIDRAASAERRCIGCHATGLVPEFSPGTGEWRAGYASLGVGCESCHGPGAAHVVSGGDPLKIVNPRGLADGTADGAARADAACASCHTRGTGGALAGSTTPVEFPWSTVLGRPFRPGDRVADFVLPSADPADHWGFRDNLMAPASPTPGFPADDAFVAARSGRMQGTEHASGVHASAAGARCFDCHAAHGSAHASSLIERTRGPEDYPVSAADGSLCLSCHAGTGPFATLGAADVAAFARGQASAVPASVIDHMADAAAMPVAAAAFDPAGTGVGRCTTCHMASTAQERRGAGTDRAGFATGGPRGGTHVGRALWPSTGERHGVTGACTSCHPASGADPAGKALLEWAVDEGDGDGRFHGASPRGEHTGVLNASPGPARRCAECHTTPGFRGIAVEGDASGLSTDGARLAAIVEEGVRFEEGVTCAACHGKQGDGTYAAGANPLRRPAATLCASCHEGAGITLAAYGAGNAVHFPQSEMVEGTAGAEPPGSGFYEDAGHVFLPKKCVSCHFDTAVAARNHGFRPRVETCQVCHPTATSVDIPTFGDYDGDGAREGIQGEVAGLLAVLKTAILTGDAAVTFDGTGFRRNGVPGLPGATAARQRAAYNWEVVSKDGSRGAHNGPRAVKLLQQSYKELTGSDVPGAVMR